MGSVNTSELIPNQHKVISDPFTYEHITKPLSNIPEEKSLVPGLRSQVTQKPKVTFPWETGFS